MTERCPYGYRRIEGRCRKLAPESFHSISGIRNDTRQYFRGTHNHWENQDRWERRNGKWKFYGYDSEIELVSYVNSHSK